VGLKRGLSRPVGACAHFVPRSQGGARPSLALGWLVAGRWPEDMQSRTLRAKGRQQASPAQARNERRAGSTARKIIKPQRARDQSCHTRCIPQNCYAPMGLLPIVYFQTQGGARPSLALGWLVAGRWPEETMLGLKEAGQASSGQSEPASDALGQQPAKPSSPNGARQRIISPSRVPRAGDT